MLGTSLTIMMALIVVWVAFAVTSQGGATTLESDFRVLWAAARLFLEGEPLAAFQSDRVRAVYDPTSTDWMPWLYPPGYLFVMAPLGALPYAPAFLAMTLLSVAAMALAARPFVGGVGPAWAALTLAPAYLPTLVIGQNSLVWLAVLLAALYALRSGRPILAGVLIGCLTLKPQLGLMLPVALLAAWQWRAILAAGATALLLAGLPTLAVGPEYWPLLATQLADHAERMITLTPDLDLLVSPGYLPTRLGLAPSTALSMQWALTALCALSVAVFWRSRRVGFDAKVALLLTAILLSAPYLWYYEAAMMAAIGLFLLRAGILVPRGAQAFLLVLLWIGAGLQSANVFLQLVPDRYLGGVIATPTLFLAFFLCWHHLWSLRAADPAA